MNPFQELAQGVFIDGEICLLKIQQAKGGLLGQRTVCDKSVLSEIA